MDPLCGTHPHRSSLAGLKRFAGYCLIVITLAILQFPSQVSALPVDSSEPLIARASGPARTDPPLCKNLGSLFPCALSKTFFSEKSVPELPSANIDVKTMIAIIVPSLVTLIASFVIIIMLIQRKSRRQPRTRPIELPLHVSDTRGPTLRERRQPEAYASRVMTLHVPGPHKTATFAAFYANLPEISNEGPMVSDLAQSTKSYEPAHHEVAQPIQSHKTPAQAMAALQEKKLKKLSTGETPRVYPAMPWKRPDLANAKKPGAAEVKSPPLYLRPGAHPNTVYNENTANFFTTIRPASPVYKPMSLNKKSKVPPPPQPHISKLKPGVHPDTKYTEDTKWAWNG